MDGLDGLDELDGLDGLDELDGLDGLDGLDLRIWSDDNKFLNNSNDEEFLSFPGRRL